MEIKAIGVYPVEAREPCFLIEFEVKDCTAKFDVGDFTQPIPDQPRSNWQVPFAERYLDVLGRTILNAARPDEQPDQTAFSLIFFFHYLDYKRPIESPAGPIALPPLTELPDRLGFLSYEPP